MKLLPGKKGKTFTIQFENTSFIRKGDVLETSHSVTVMVLKVYKNTWWRKLLRRLGFRVKSFQCKAVKQEVQHG